MGRVNVAMNIAKIVVLRRMDILHSEGRNNCRNGRSSVPDCEEL